MTFKWVDRLSEERLSEMEQFHWGEIDCMPEKTHGEMICLIRGYRRAETAEVILRDWVQHSECMHARYQDEPCADCIEFTERSVALLGECASG